MYVMGKVFCSDGGGDVNFNLLYVMCYKVSYWIVE